MVARPQVQSTKNLGLTKGIKYLLWKGHGILVLTHAVVDWAILPTHALLCPIAKNILFGWHHYG
jgi:hypothetical protein